VREQHAAVCDRDDIVVEGAGGDGFLALLDEQGARRIERVAAATALLASICWRAGKGPPATP
jgi:hypothetical protein